MIWMFRVWTVNPGFRRVWPGFPVSCSDPVPKISGFGVNGAPPQEAVRATKAGFLLWASHRLVNLDVCELWAPFCPFTTPRNVGLVGNGRMNFCEKRIERCTSLLFDVWFEPPWFSKGGGWAFNSSRTAHNCKGGTSLESLTLQSLILLFSPLCDLPVGGHPAFFIVLSAFILQPPSSKQHC